MKRADDLLHYARIRDGWERRSCGFGTKGERLYDWTAFAVEVKEEKPAEGFAHWLVLRRSLHANRRGKDGQLHREVAYFLVHAPDDTNLKDRYKGAERGTGDHVGWGLYGVQRRAEVLVHSAGAGRGAGDDGVAEMWSAPRASRRVAGS